MVLVPLTQGFSAIVDPQDASRVFRYKWHARKSRTRGLVYAWAHITVAGRRTSIAMHRLIAGAAPGEMVDHKNFDGLDNRRDNLRKADCTQSSRHRRMPRNNTTGYKGVVREPSGRFKAAIYHDGVRVHLGSYATKQDAARAYDRTAIHLFGEFACLNFPDFDYSDTPLPTLREPASAFRGVVRDKRRGHWYAVIRDGGKRHWLGRFGSEEAAAHAYDKKAVELHGRSAVLNFPGCDYSNYVAAPLHVGTSRRRGVSWDKRRNKWRATLTVSGQQHHLGHFVTEEEAEAAYSAAKCSELD